LSADYRKGKSLFATTANSFGTGEGVTITPNDVSGLPTGNLVLTFDREVTGKVERIKGAISGSNFVVASGGRGYDGTTEQVHTSPNVEYIYNGADQNDAVDAFVAEHSVAGVHDATKVAMLAGTQTFTGVKTLASPVINTGVSGTAIDTDGTLAANSDTLLPSQKAVKTYVTANGSPADGWIAATGTWTYASATTITVPSGAAALYQKGDRIKLTQTTAKYFVIVTVADTLLTVTGGTDYTVANATITSPYYSHQVNPIGFPTWFNWTPTFSCSGSMTISAGSIGLSKFSLTGTTCTVAINYAAFTLGGSADLSIYFTLPISSVRSASNTANNANAIPIVDGATGKIGQITIKDTTPGSAMIRNTNTSNWTLGSTNSFILGTLIYEI
jgi:hypothetical protein